MALLGKVLPMQVSGGDDEGPLIVQIIKRGYDEDYNPDVAYPALTSAGR
jgi:hypothetical protein